MAVGKFGSKKLVMKKKSSLEKIGENNKSPKHAVPYKSSFDGDNFYRKIPEQPLTSRPN